MIFRAVVAQDTDQKFLQTVAKMTRAQQSDTAVQQHLRDVLWRGATIFMHGRLAELECQPLFSLGDESLFRRALVVSGGRNLVYVEGDKAPQHIDDSHYLLPANTWKAYLPISPQKETFWHEMQHDLLTGYTDAHHELIEELAERSVTAYAVLAPFEKEIKKAQSEVAGRKIDAEEERALWGSAHQLWSTFLSRYHPVRKVGVSGMSLEEYRQVTGIYFSSPSQLAEWYRAGNVKTADGTPATPPEWVFKSDLLLAPVDLDVFYEAPVQKGSECNQKAVVVVRGESRLVSQGLLAVVRTWGFWSGADVLPPSLGRRAESYRAQPPPSPGQELEESQFSDCESQVPSDWDDWEAACGKSNAFGVALGAHCAYNIFI